MSTSTESVAGGEDSNSEPVNELSIDITPRKGRKQPFRFSPVVDELLLKETLAHNPFGADFGSATTTWVSVPESLDCGVDEGAAAIVWRRC